MKQQKFTLYFIVSSNNLVFSLILKCGNKYNIEPSKIKLKLSSLNIIEQEHTEQQPILMLLFYMDTIWFMV